jgi:hypothetical protein
LFSVVIEKKIISKFCREDWEELSCIFLLFHYCRKLCFYTSCK